MLDELTTTIKAQLYERVSSPLLSSFAIAWCGWNYKFLLVIFSGMSSYEKITYIDMNLFPDLPAKIIYGAVLPLLTSLFLIYVYPVPAEYIYKHVKTKQKRLKEIQQSIDDDSPISKEQARKIRRETLENQLKYEGEIDAKNSENSRLKEMISELQQQISKASESLRQSPPIEEIDDAAPEKEGEDPSNEDFPDLVAMYEAAKREDSSKDSKSPADDRDEDGRQDTLDIYMRDNLLEYISKLIAFAGIRFDVKASNGEITVFLGTDDGEFEPYISGVYQFETALDVLDSVKNALADESPPGNINGKKVANDFSPSNNFSVARDYIEKGLVNKKSIPEIRSDLLKMGVSESVFNSAITDYKKSIV